MDYLNRLQVRYIEEVWGDDLRMEAFAELEEQIKVTQNVAKKRYYFCVYFIKKSFLYQLKRYLGGCVELCVYGFNSARFDLPLMLPYIVNWALLRGVPIGCLKRGTSYITLRVGELVFKDALQFNSPVPLAKFLK